MERTASRAVGPVRTGVGVSENAAQAVAELHSQIALEDAALVGAAQGAAARDGRRVVVVERMGLPWDHPVEAASLGRAETDRGDYLKTLVLRVEGK